VRRYEGRVLLRLTKVRYTIGLISTLGYIPFGRIDLKKWACKAEYF